MSDELLDFIEDHAVSDEFYPLDKGLFAYHQITVNPVIAIEIWISGESGPFFKGVGSSKPNPNYDKFNFVRGTSIALRRAAKDFMFVWGRERVQDMKDNLEALEEEEERLFALLNQALDDLDEESETKEDWVVREKISGIAKEPSSDDKRSKLDVPTAFHVR